MKSERFLCKTNINVACDSNKGGVFFLSRTVGGGRVLLDWSRL